MMCIVHTEPALLPVNPNDFGNRTNKVEGARLDIAARGLTSAFERTFFDVRVSHPLYVCMYVDRGQRQALFSALNLLLDLRFMYATAMSMDSARR